MSRENSGDQIKLLNSRYDSYVYAYVREDGTLYYTGKGTGRRFLHTKNDKIKCPNDRSQIKIIAKNLLEHESKPLEIKLIAPYGRKDTVTGILVNLTNGDEDSSGRLISQKALHWKSAYTRMLRTAIKHGRACV